MKLWILCAKEGIKKGDDPWASLSDNTSSIVVRAENESAARKVAASGVIWDGPPFGAWVFDSAEYTTCTELTAEGAIGVVIQDARGY